MDYGGLEWGNINQFWQWYSNDIAITDVGNHSLIIMINPFKNLCQIPVPDPWKSIILPEIYTVDSPPVHMEQLPHSAQASRNILSKSVGESKIGAVVLYDSWSKYPIDRIWDFIRRQLNTTHPPVDH